MKLIKYLPITIVIILSQSISAQWTNPDLTLTGRQILCFANKDLSVLAGTNGGLVLSTNSGSNWTNIAEDCHTQIFVHCKCGNFSI